MARYAGQVLAPTEGFDLQSFYALPAHKRPNIQLLPILGNSWHSLLSLVNFSINSTLRGSSSSSCRGLWPSAKALFPHPAQKGLIYCFCLY